MIMKKIVDIRDIALKDGFKIYIQTFTRNENLIGYVWVENINFDKRIVIDENILNEMGLESEYYFRYYIALALSYFKIANVKENYYKQIKSNIHDIEVEDLAKKMLIPEKEFNKYSKKYNNDIVKLMNHFKVPSTVIEEILNDKKKGKVKTLKK